MVIFIDEKQAFTEMGQKKIERQAGVISFPEMKVGKEGGIGDHDDPAFPLYQNHNQVPESIPAVDDRFGFLGVNAGMDFAHDGSLPSYVRSRLKGQGLSVIPFFLIREPPFYFETEVVCERISWG
jgi:hypothetical protein